MSITNYKSQTPSTDPGVSDFDGHKVASAVEAPESAVADEVQAGDGLHEIRAVNLVDAVFAQIRSAIVDKSLPPGRRVTESALALRLNVSKTPVREALLRLKQIGLVEPDGRRGLQVVAPSRTVLNQAFDVREALEVFCANAAAKTATKKDRAAIAHAAERSLAGAIGGDYLEFSRWNDRFHRCIVEVVHNPRLTALNADACSLIAALRSRDLPPSEASIACGELHVVVATAISEGDDAAASARMGDHLQAVRSYVLDLFDVLDEGARGAKATGAWSQPAHGAASPPPHQWND